MSSTTQWLIILIGLAVSAALLFYIVRHNGKLKQQRQAQAQQRLGREKRRQDAIQSVRVLAMTIEQDQVDLSEACIRIHGLLQVLAPELLAQPPYQVFRTMAEETAHMPTHEKRQESDKRFVRRMDHQRAALEEKHQSSIREAAVAIRRYPFGDCPPGSGVTH